MEIPETEPITELRALGTGGREQRGYAQYSQSGHRPDDRERGERRLVDIASLLGVSPQSVSPQIKAAIGELMDELEGLRVRLEQVEGRAHHMEELADRDPVLKVLNRRALMRELAHIIDHCRQNQVPGNLALFELVNHRDLHRDYGRRTADAALVYLAQAIDSRVRRSDVLGGLGGTLLGLILTVSPEEGALTKVSNMVAEIETGGFVVEGVRLPLRIAAAVHSFAEDDTADTCLDRTDRLLRSVMNEAAAAG